MRTLAITNQKGGVGKTTTAVNLAACFAAVGQRVLLIDLDPQGNATTGCGIARHAVLPTVYELLLGMNPFAQVKITTEFKFDLLPANRNLAGAEIELIQVEQREFRLRQALAAVAQDYDVVLLDCPPALNLLTVNGLAAADALVIPMQCEYYALEGLSDLDKTWRKVRASLNPNLRIEGLVRTMVNAQSTLTQHVSQELERHFGALVYHTVIPRNVRVAEAPSYGKPVLAYDPNSKGALAYKALAQEMLSRWATSSNVAQEHKGQA